MENDSRQMGPLTSVSPCSAPVTTELFCHLCCHQIRLIQEVERRAFPVTLNHRGKWLCVMCAFCERDWLYYFPQVEKEAWCGRVWISDEEDMLWWGGYFELPPNLGFLLVNWDLSPASAYLNLRSPVWELRSCAGLQASPANHAVFMSRVHSPTCS